MTKALRYKQAKERVKYEGKHKEKKKYTMKY